MRRIGAIVNVVSLATVFVSTAWAQAPKPAAPTAPAATPTTAHATSTAGMAPVRAAPAPGRPPNPKKLLEMAAAKRAAGDFEGALADYQVADSLAPSPATIEGIAFCHDKLGHFDEALVWYDGFLSNVPIPMQLEGDAAKTRVEVIKKMPGHLRLESQPSNAVVTIDGKQELTHTPLDVDLSPGKHTLHVAAADHEPVDRDIDVTSRSKQNVALELLLTPPPPAPPPPPVVIAPPPPPPPPHSIVPAIVTGGIAVIAAGIGTGFGIAALSDKSNFNSHPTTSTANSGENNALVSDMGFGVALTLGVTSVILFTTRNEVSAAAPHSPLAPTTPASPAPAPEASPAPAPKASNASKPVFSAAPFVTPHGGGAGAMIRF